MAQEMTWTTVSDSTEQEPETKIVFDTIGDEFTGYFLGTRVIEPADITEKPYRQARFEGVDNEGEKTGEVFFTNMGFSLREGLKTVRAGSLVRITYTDDTDTGQASPMKGFRIEVARPSQSKVSRNT